MQEINELKGLVVQSLEANGVLSQLRAQIRSSVFRVIDASESEQKKSAMFWENPKCQQIYNETEGKVCLQLMHDLMVFYKMDYSLSVFTNEANLGQVSSLQAQDVNRQLNCTVANDQSTPLLLQILQTVKTGGSSSAQPLDQTPLLQEHQHQIQQLQEYIQEQQQFNEKQDSENAEVLAQKEKEKQTLKKEVTTMKQQMQKMKEKEQEQEREVGKLKKQMEMMQEQFQSEQEQLQQQFEQQMMEQQEMIEQYLQQQQSHRDDQDDQVSLQQPDLNQFHQSPQQQPEEEVIIHTDNQDHPQLEYDQDDFQQYNEDSEYMQQQRQQEDEKGEEDEEEEGEEEEEEEGQGITQSHGFDMSVDSQALEEYDYAEDILQP